jgi:acetylornithine deacetylase/succinyl-diaminopimelate desuccinylase-like protein
MPETLPDPMHDWEPLLDHLAEAPRENGTAALHESARWLEETLRGVGVADVQLVDFVAHPYALRLAGVLVLASLLLYRRWLREGRALAAAALVVASSAVVLVDLDRYVPIFSWIGAQSQPHVVARIPAATAPEQRVILSAHFDTKTDVFDHVERAPVDFLALPVTLFLLAGALAAWRAPRSPRRGRALRRVARAAGVVAPLYGVAAFLVFSGGAFLPARSPGAIDDGAACAVLVRAAEALAAAPLARTEIEVALLSAEEVGVQGSYAWAAERFRTPPDLPTFVLNLDPIGVSPDLDLVRRESFVTRAFDPDPRIVARLEEAYLAVRGKPLGRTPVGGGTDARSFLAHGIPAATLSTQSSDRFFVRHLHSAHDTRERLDPAALGETLRIVLAFARGVDERGL